VRTLKRLLREPLTVFLLIAAALFGLDAWRGDADLAARASGVAGDGSESEIVVTADIVAALEDDFAFLEGRPPTAEETERIVQAWLDEEIVFREALRQGMHWTDGKVRASLIEKVRVLWAGEPEQPTEEQLVEHYVQNMDRYYSEPRVTFRQVFYEQKPEQPERVLEQLRRGDRVAGDAFWLGEAITDYAESILRSSFGGEFYNQLAAAPLGQWIGPVASPRGHHYVLVTERRAPEPLAYANIRERLVRDWIEAQQLRHVAERTELVKGSFSIVFDTARAAPK
jgi:hypothetical protein